MELLQSLGVCFQNGGWKELINCLEFAKCHDVWVNGQRDTHTMRQKIAAGIILSFNDTVAWCNAEQVYHRNVFYRCEVYIENPEE